MEINVNFEIQKLRTQLALTEKLLANTPDHPIRVRQLNGRLHVTEFCNNESGKRCEKYVPLHSPDCIQKMISRQYHQRLHPLLMKELKALENFSAAYHPDLKYRLIQRYPLLAKSYIENPMISPEEFARKWELSSYYRNPMEIAGDYYESKKGDPVRSKAELILSNFFFDCHIPQHYEEVLEINGRERFPDFTIMNPHTMDLFFVEYFGLMNDPNYASNAMRKIAEYQQSEYAGQMIYFFESSSSPMNMKAIKNTIFRRLKLDEAR